jgi:hypothetical protein
MSKLIPNEVTFTPWLPNQIEMSGAWIEDLNILEISDNVVLVSHKKYSDGGNVPYHKCGRWWMTRIEDNKYCPSCTEQVEVPISFIKKLMEF